MKAVLPNVMLPAPVTVPDAGRCQKRERRRGGEQCGNPATIAVVMVLRKGFDGSIRPSGMCDRCYAKSWRALFTEVRHVST